MKRVNSQKSFASNNSVNHEHIRDQIRKQLLDCLIVEDKEEKVKDKITELSESMENEIFNIAGQDAKSKTYREKCKKFIARIKGNRNSHIRQLLINGILEINNFCALKDEQLGDDKYFMKFNIKEIQRVKACLKIPKSSEPRKEEVIVDPYYNVLFY
jgi:urease accessory protein UreH